MEQLLPANYPNTLWKISVVPLQSFGRSILCHKMIGIRIFSHRLRRADPVSQSLVRNLVEPTGSRNWWPQLIYWIFLLQNEVTIRSLKTFLIPYKVNNINLRYLLWKSFNSFLSLRVFGLLSSSLLLFPQRFGRYVLRPSSGVCRTREPSRNFELRPLLNPPGSPVLIPLAITGYKC